jgi:adenylate cyclase
LNDQGSRASRIFAELKRRKVLQACAGYAVVAWILLQVGEVTFEPLHLPDWTLTLLVVMVIAGFPVALVLAWFFDLSLKGIRREEEMSLGERRQSGGDSAPQSESAPGIETVPDSSIAVLAFEDMSSAGDQDYLCDGIAEEILNRLSQICRLKVASRTSSFRYKEQPADISTIAQQLKVATVLEGSVRKAGSNLRITTQLINAADGFHLWSHSYDRKLDDIFKIQDEIASRVAEELQVTLAGEPADDCETSDAEAYEYYLKGLHYFRRWGQRNVQYAIGMFRRAVEIDPVYARCLAALGESNAMVCMYWNAADEYLAAAENASRRALELAPDLAEAHVSRGLSHVVHHCSENAIAEFERALLLNPELFEGYYFYGRVRFQRGELELASSLFERAEEVRPDDFQAPIFLRQIYLALGRRDEALAAALRGTTRAERHLELNPDDTRALNLGLGGLAILGEHDRVMQWAERSLKLDGENADTLYNIACGYAQVGEPEKALDCLERAILHGTSIGEWAENDSDLDSLRGHPRFVLLLQKLRGD